MTRHRSAHRHTRPDARGIIAIAALALATMALACGQSSAPAGSITGLEKPRLMVGIISVTSSYLPIYLAIDDGLFEKEGLTVELMSFRGGSDLIRALVAGSIDVGVVSLAEVTSAIDAGQPLRAFYGGFNVPAFDWYAVPSITSLADTRGKRFGVTQYGSSTDFMTRYALTANGIDPATEVQIIQGGDSPTRFAAMQAGQIDVNVFAPPDTFIAAERGYNLIFSQKSLATDYPYHVFAATDAFIAGHPKTITALLRGFVLGTRAAKADRDHSAAALVRRVGMDEKYAGRTYDELIGYIHEDGRLPTEKGLEVFFEMGIKAGRYTEPWPREKYWTPAYADSYSQWKPPSSTP